MSKEKGTKLNQNCTPTIHRSASRTTENSNTRRSTNEIPTTTTTTIIPGPSSSIINSSLIHFDVNDLHDIEHYLLPIDEDSLSKILTPRENTTQDGTTNIIESLQIEQQQYQNRIPSNNIEISHVSNDFLEEEQLLKRKQGLLQLTSYFNELDADSTVCYKDHIELLLLMTKHEIDMVEDQMKLKKMRFEYKELEQRRFQHQERCKIIRSTYKRKE